MRTYWSNTKFADWVRGTKKIYAGTSEEWNIWESNSKSHASFRHWLAEDGLDSIQNIVNWPSEQINSLRYYLNNRFSNKTHALTSTLAKGKWHEYEERLLYCMFDSYIDFIEIETAWHHVLWSEESRKQFKTPWWQRKWYFRWFKQWRCPEASIAHLEWEMRLTDNWGDTDEYSAPSIQALAAKEKWALYYWWKYVRPHRVDPYEHCGWSAYCTGKAIDKMDKEISGNIIRKMDALEAQYDAEDEEMMTRLIKLRKSLWT